MNGDADWDAEVEAPVAPPTNLALADKRIWFVGKLGGFTRREAHQVVRQVGGTPADAWDATVNLIVIGADEIARSGPEDLLPVEARDAVAAGRCEIISETQLWQRLGLVDADQPIRRLYTPAMLAELLQVSVATIRRWRRRGLIVPAREVHRLPYFDFQEVATARRLAELVAAGASPAAIEQKLADLARYLPDVERPLAQLSIIVEGRQLLLRQGEGLLEPSGQRRIDFEAFESRAAASRDGQTPDTAPPDDDSDNPSILAFPTADDDHESPTPNDLALAAEDAEDEGRIDAAIELVRAALAAGGPRPELCFHLAELLYRQGELGAARERYFMAVELDEDYVEARANLGCVLVELGHIELALAAFTGALKFHPDYPDAHYHLARLLDELHRAAEAEEHWRAFLKLSPDSPWASEARARLRQ